MDFEQLKEEIEEWKRLYPYYPKHERFNRCAKCFLCGEYFERKTNTQTCCSQECMTFIYNLRDRLKRGSKTVYEWELDMRTWQWSRKWRPSNEELDKEFSEFKERSKNAHMGKI